MQETCKKIKRGAKIKAFDPKALDNAKRIFGDKIVYSQNAYDAIEATDAMILLTEWNEFRRPDFDRIKGLLKQPVIFDGRNQYDTNRLLEKGFSYYKIG